LKYDVITYAPYEGVRYAIPGFFKEDVRDPNRVPKTPLKKLLYKQNNYENVSVNHLKFE